MFWRCLVDCQLLYGRLWLRLWWASRNLSVWHFHWHWCTFFPSFRRTFCSRWSGGISRDWLDMDPVSGILCSGCVVFHGVWSLSVHWNNRPTWPSGLLVLRFFINMTVWCCSSLGGSPLLSLSFVLSACFTLLWPALMLFVLSNRLSGIEGRSDLTFLWNINS